MNGYEVQIPDLDQIIREWSAEDKGKRICSEGLSLLYAFLPQLSELKSECNWGPTSSDYTASGPAMSRRAESHGALKMISS